MGSAGIDLRPYTLRLWSLHDSHMTAGGVNVDLTYADEAGWLSYAALLPDLGAVQQVVTEETWDWNGLRVHVDRLATEGATAKVIMVHGIGGYGRLVLGAFGLSLADAGFEVVAPDLPGYGLTEVPPDRLTWQLWLDCVRALVDRELTGDDRPVVLYGLSLGGVVAYHVAAASPRVSAVAATTLLDLRDREVLAGVARWPGIARWVLPVVFRLRRFTDPLALPSRLMSKMGAIANDPELARRCGRDPLGGATRLPLRFFRTAAQADPVLEPEHFDRPVLIVHPAEDRMTDIRFTRRFVERLGGRARLVELEGCGHFPIEDPGAGVLRETVIEFFRQATEGDGGPRR
jgi:alpha-beta hydrolase superfamily lysophospholipase